MSGPSCTAPIPWERLVDYWTGEIGGDEGASIEEHLIACARCSGELQAVARLADGVGRATPQLHAHGGISPALLDRFERDGCVVRRYRGEAGGEVHCTVGRDDDFVTLELSADLAGLSRVDYLLCRPDGTVLQRGVDLPVTAERTVVWSSRGDMIRALPTSELLARLVAVEEQGDRVVAEYRLHHTAYRG